MSKWREVLGQGITARLAWRITLAVAALAVVGFLSLHYYAAGGGVMYNVMNGEIYLTPACPAPPQGQGSLERLIASRSSHWPACGLIIPYRWILGLAIVISAASFIAVRRK
jgi:hypothetical protein